ncbi:ferritin-like domain-containing protein [Mesorhizobium sp. CCANP35]|uniref:Ferritin-like domain-containing protein n=2 Tax=Mesorhizobium neociceri TaxID=1307853 RepID=A0A838BBU5_9HYPH|nr:ferritin-like domain-containing protein [Mesorhizobium neociceri]
MQLGVLGDHGVGQRHAYAAADVAGDVDQSRRLIGLLRRQPDIGGGGNGYEQESDHQVDAGNAKKLKLASGVSDVIAKQINCPAIDGILEEANDVSGDVDDKGVLDAALIASAQAVEHYEMTRYGTLIAWAKQLDRSDCANVLAKNLKEEQAADRKLTEMADRKINLQAAE